MNIEGKTFLVVEQDQSGLLLADVSNGWAGIGHARLVRVSTSDDQDIDVTALKDAK